MTEHNTPATPTRAELAATLEPFLGGVPCTLPPDVALAYSVINETGVGGSHRTARLLLALHAANARLARQRTLAIVGAAVLCGWTCDRGRSPFDPMYSWAWRDRSDTRRNDRLYNQWHDALANPPLDAMLQDAAVHARLGEDFK